MNRHRRVLLRAAQRIQEQIAAIQKLPSLPALSNAEWNAWQQLGRQYEQARSRSWTHAAADLRERIQYTLGRLVEELREIHSQLSATIPSGSIPSLGEIYDELSALEADHERVSIDLSARTVSVVTDRIVLEEIDLGPFEVRLHWDRIGERRPYETLALAPNPPYCGDESTTHPHVQGNSLCEGDGRVPIDRALRSGRLSDFFAIVNRILQTYNPASPYVSLDDWHGQPCGNCGELLIENDESHCQRCSETLCGDCLTLCERCDDGYCHACVSCCGTCGSTICGNCEIDCADCGRHCCSACVSGTNLCEGCQDEPEPEFEDSDDSQPETTPASAAETPGEAA